jgi:hypothetical protein
VANSARSADVIGFVLSFAMSVTECTFIEGQSTGVNRVFSPINELLIGEDLPGDQRGLAKYPLLHSLPCDRVLSVNAWNIAISATIKH